MSIFGDETTPAAAESPEEGHDEAAAVDTESEAADDNQDDVEAGEGSEEQGGEQADSEEGDEAPEHSDELLAGKYKTVDDLARGYKELERAFHQQRSGGQQPATPAQTAVVAQPGAQPAQQPDMNQVFWDRFRENPFDTMRSLVEFSVNQQTAPIFEERQIQTAARNLETLSKEYGQISTEEGLSQLIGKAREVAADMGISDHMNQRVLRMAAQEAFPQTKAQLIKHTKDAARAETERARQSKQGLGAPKGTRRTEPEMTEEQSIKAGILAAGRGGGLFG